MPFVKLDCGMLNSTLWLDRAGRELFITALLMAVPYEVETSTPQLSIFTLDHTGWHVPPGWYGLVEAAGPGIISRAGIAKDNPLFDSYMQALSRLGDPEPESRSHAFDGRRFVRIDGGFLVLNFMAYREKDSTAAIRSKRWRDRHKTSRVSAVTQRVARVENVTQRRTVTANDTIAEAEAEERKKETPVVPLTPAADPTAASPALLTPEDAVRHAMARSMKRPHRTR